MIQDWNHNLRQEVFIMGVSTNRGNYPKMDSVKIMENPSKIDDLGVCTPIFGNTHIHRFFGDFGGKFHPILFFEAGRVPERRSGGVSSL